MSNRQKRVTTTITPSANNTGNSSSSRARTGLARPVITPQLAQDPARVSKTILDFVEDVARGIESARTSPFNTAFIQKGVSYTCGVQLNIRHSIGKPWSYVFPLHFYPYSVPVSIVESNAPPTGVTKSNCCSVYPTGNGMLAGTFFVTNGSVTVTSTYSQTGLLNGGTNVQFLSQIGTNYTVTSVNSTTIVLSGSYNGTTTTTSPALIVSPLTGSMDVVIL